MTIQTSLLISSGSASDKIGQERWISDRGYLVVDQDNAEWLRSGTMASTASYPVAATLDHMKAIGLLSTNATSIAALDAATDGAGRFVIAYGDATNVLVSTDSGVTWATVAHNAGGAVDSVCYSSTFGLWICSGNTGGTLFITSSQTQASVASAWTARTGTATVSGTAGITRVRASGSVVVMVTATSTASVVCASRSTNGTTWTASGAFGSNGVSSTTGTRLATDGSGNWISIGRAGNQCQKSTDGGVTWANLSLPTTAYGIAFGAGLFVITNSAGKIYTSPTGSTWTDRGAIAAGGSVITTGSSLMHDGTNFLIPAGFTGGNAIIAYSSDGISYKTRQLSVGFTTAGSFVIAGDGTKSIFANGAAGTVIGYSANFNTADFVGITNKTSTAPTSSDGQAVIYSRVK